MFRVILCYLEHPRPAWATFDLAYKYIISK